MEIFRDRDYIQDINGDIYQVIGSIHPREGITCLQKYKRVKGEPSDDEINDLIPSDKISQYKKHKLRYWIQKGSNDKFIRILPNYSSQSARNNIKQHRYCKYSEIFNTKLILVPLDKISTHWEPQDKFHEILKVIQEGSFEDRKKLDSLEREMAEVILEMQDIFNIDINNVGVTGSILWGAQHDESDIDLMIYGKNNQDKVLNKGFKLSENRKGLRRYLKIEILPIAEKLAIKTGLPMEECFEYIFKKSYMFFHGQRKVSITFAPTKEELIFSPLYTLKSRFNNKGRVKAAAKVLSTKWGLYYPGVFQIELISIEWEEKADKRDIKTLNKEVSRLLVYEHELVGFYNRGDIIEIKGLLQECLNIPKFEGTKLFNSYQILVGGHETFGNEYIRIKNK